MADNGNWYVMSEEDYYYTLAYHAILQKNDVNPQYIDKLNVMGKKLGVCVGNKEDHLRNLNHYMNRQGYQYVQPEDSSVPFQWKYIDHARWELEKKKINAAMFDKIRKTVWRGVIYSKNWAGIHI